MSAETLAHSLKWVDRLPSGWKTARLKYLAAIRYGLGQPPPAKTDGVPMVRATNVKKGIITDVGMMFVDPDEVPDGREAILQTDDILVVRSGAYTGDSAIVPKRFEGAIAGYDMVLRPAPFTCARYLAWALLSVPLLDAQILFESMRAAQPHLNAEELGNVLAPFPPLETQRRIADYLDRETARIDALIAAKERLLTILAEKRRTLITHAVTRGLNPGAPLRDTGDPWLGMIPEHWELTRLKFLAEVRTGLTIGKDYAAKALQEYPYLRVANVQDGYLALDDVTTVAVPEDEARSCALAVGDVLMNEGGDIDKLGRGCVWRGEISLCLHQNHVFCVRPHSVDPEWLATWTATLPAKSYFEARAKRTTNLASISSTNIKELPVPFPPRSEQQAILRFVTQGHRRLDTISVATQRTAALLRERRSALIAAAVTGRLPVDR